MSVPTREEGAQLPYWGKKGFVAVPAILLGIKSYNAPMGRESGGQLWGGQCFLFDGDQKDICVADTPSLLLRIIWDKMKPMELLKLSESRNCKGKMNDSPFLIRFVSGRRSLEKPWKVF